VELKARPVRIVKSTRERAAAAVVIAGSVALLGLTAGYLLELDIFIRLQLAVDRRAPIESIGLGKPSEVWTGSFECREGWACDECRALSASLKPSSSVNLYGRMSAFYVEVSADRSVERFVHCGS